MTKHPLSFLGDAFEKVTRTAFNAIEGVQTAPFKAAHAYLGTDPELERGDHISVYQGYLHHGLYIGSGMVIHFTKLNGKGIIRMDSLDTFKDGKAIEKRCSPLKCTLEEAINKAYSKLHQTGYNLIFNNCDHFVVWCRDGNEKKTYTTSSAAWQVMGNK